MLIWLLSGVGAVAIFAIYVIRNAELDDKQRKSTKRTSTPDNWK